MGIEDGGCFFKNLKTRTNQQPDINDIPKPLPNANPELNLNSECYRYLVADSFSVKES